jgi:reverse transcriptase-like protein
MPFQWDTDCQIAFDELKKQLASAPVLRHYQPDLPTRIETDASDEAIAGVLSQQKGNPVAYYSKSMSPPEQNHEIHDKEMLAIISMYEHWKNGAPNWKDHRGLCHGDYQALEPQASY